LTIKVLVFEFTNNVTSSVVTEHVPFVAVAVFVRILVVEFPMNAQSIHQFPQNICKVSVGWYVAIEK
jgi:hypothetical protein